MRCRNCGLLGHKTQTCPRYGPWYPEPGKTKEDYAKDAERIANLVAADVIAEHEGHELQDEYVTNKSGAKRMKPGRPRRKSGRSIPDPETNG